MDILKELLEAEKVTEQEQFRNEMIEAIYSKIPEHSEKSELDFGFVCEFSSRLQDAEEFQDFIPAHYQGTGAKGRKLRVDGYEIDELDDSIRLLIADFNGSEDMTTITKTKAEAIFAQLRAFVEESISGKIWSSSESANGQSGELSSLIQQRHSIVNGTRSVSRYRFYLITDSLLSNLVKNFALDDIDGVPVEFLIWDIKRLWDVSKSVTGSEELIIDFTEFKEGGLPCLRASETEEYEGYLCVIDGDTLADLYDRYGSRLLEGNVRSFLTTAKNRGIQKTIRTKPDHFFVYNNGISTTATDADVQETNVGARLMSVKFLQIVNGGQTTASLHLAKRKDKADLRDIQIQMKLTVVKTSENGKLDSMIQDIAKYSNTQNGVADSDFFSNHPFHRAVERRSRALMAPAAAGVQFNTYWFYERVRGQYNNEQSKMTLAQKKKFLRENPKAQLISKTSLATYENTWRELPYIACRHAQKNFTVFADYVGKEFGENGLKFDNDVYFKEMVAKAIIFKFTEKMVSQAKSTWYGGGFRSQIVIYTVAKLVSMIQEKALGSLLDLQIIWARQSVSPTLAKQLEAIAMAVSSAITTPPIAGMNVGEWCKNEKCWASVMRLGIDFTSDLTPELISVKNVSAIDIATREQSGNDVKLNAVIEVVNLAKDGTWVKLHKWSQQYSPVFGKDADLLRNAMKANWIPSDSQAATLLKILRRLDAEGFQAK